MDVRTIILETYAQMLLNQDKALLSNLIFCNSIVVPLESIKSIIKAITKSNRVDIKVSENIKSCALKYNPIAKIETIKIIKDNGEIITDFKNAYYKEYNELINEYHLNLIYCIK